MSDGASEKHFMAYSQGRNFLFCDLCGSLLNLNSNKYAQCPLCKLQRNDIRRDLGISIIPEEKVQLQKPTFTSPRPCVKREPCALGTTFIFFSGKQTDAKTCEKCGHNEHTYYSRQMRSADEGATTFYVCTNCQHQSTENRYIPEIVRDYGTCS